ncbi:ribosomal protein S18-alanine N-acetyltransferase [Ruminococcaceae bacterium OttesenSCG-928-I18]|nr:ribosomal protein S18-alanine N-acetyltransferase [Ruminococcaceae bacterium OttesenSCG-928-I18]
MNIRPYERGMAAACAEIAKTAPDPWKREDFDKLPGGENHACFVAVDGGGQVLGFACFLAVCESADLQLVAVAPSHRRQGVAEAMLQYGIRVMRERGLQRIFLELRVSNQAALALYKKLEFAVLIQRDRMYSKPAEDGLLMVRYL